MYTFNLHRCIQLNKIDSKDNYTCHKRFGFEINALLLNFLLIKNSLEIYHSPQKLAAQLFLSLIIIKKLLDHQIIPKDHVTLNVMMPKCSYLKR